MARGGMTRQELKSRDEITTTLFRFGDVAYERRKQILAGVAAVLILILALVGWRVYAASQETAAQGRLGQVIAIYNDLGIISAEARYQRTISEAEALIRDYGSQQATQVASYYKALAQDGLGDSAAAIAGIEDVIRNGDARLRGIARFALAGIHKRNENFDAAIAVLNELQASGDYAQSAVVLELGILHEVSDRLEEAQGYYGQVVTEFPESPLRADAEAGLRRMGFPIPLPAPVLPLP